MSGPQWGQPNEPGDPNLPQWGPPQQPPYGQPQYGQPQYGQPQYGQPEYGQPPYGQPEYGQPQYGQPQYGQPPYGQPQYGPPPTGGSGGRKGLLLGAGAVVVAGVVVLALFATGVLGGGSDSGSSPSAAVRTLLNAARSNNVAAARKALCRSDQVLSTSTLTLGSGRLSSYTIGTTTRQGTDRATVHATTETSGKKQSVDIPTAKENGTWKVCFTSGGLSSGGLGGLAGGSSGSPGVSVPSVGAPSIDIPSIGVPSIGVPSIGIPSIGAPSLANICTATSLPSGVARFYVTLAQIGSTDSAQRCVYQNSVSRSTTAGLQQSGVFYTLEPGQSDTASTFTFRSITSNASLKVTISKESDGHYYVTGVSKS